jgi:hypothetical protein
MDQDFTFFDVNSLMDFVSLSDRADHEGYLAELERLDFSQEAQARAAIRKWLVPEFEDWQGRTLVGRQRVMAALRVALSRWGFMPHVPELPGIDEGRPPYRPVQRTLALKRQFYVWVWEELFDEPFVRIAATDSLRERTDEAFVNAPNNPELWRLPQYRSLSHWDQVLRSNAWRENWPPQQA